MNTSESRVPIPQAAEVKADGSAGLPPASALAALLAYSGGVWRGAADEIQRMRDEWDR